jgi:hypothetical protein
MFGEVMMIMMMIHGVSTMLKGRYSGGIGTGEMLHLLSVTWQEVRCLSYVCQDRFSDTLDSTQ